jgi:hypothetical protein
MKFLDFFRSPSNISGARPRKLVLVPSEVGSGVHQQDYISLENGLNCLEMLENGFQGNQGLQDIQEQILTWLELS